MWFTVIGAAIGLWAVWSLVIVPYSTLLYYKRQGVHCPPLYPVIGSFPYIAKLFRTPWEQRCELLVSKPSYVWTPALGSRLAFNTVQAAKDILVTNNEMMDKAAISIQLLQPVLGASILLASEPAHTKQRRQLTPAFHFANLQRMTSAMASAMAEATQSWLSTLTDKSASFQVDMHPRLCAATLSILGRAVFGAELAEDPQIYEGMIEVLKVDGFISFWSLIPGLSKVVALFDKTKHQFRQHLDQVIMKAIAAERLAQAQHVERPINSILQLMVSAQEQNEAMTDQEVRDAAVTLMLAGHETTAQLLSWALYMMSKHPEWKKLARDEVDAVLGGRVPEYEDLAKLQVVTAILNETMRLYPPVWSLSRESKQVLTVDGVQVKPGTVMAVSIFHIHQRPDYWPRPQEFNPNRFLGEASPPPFTFIPFSVGRRDCIGRNFAIMEARIVLAMMLQHMDFDMSPDYVHCPDTAVTLRPKHGLPMTIRRRA